MRSPICVYVKDEKNRYYSTYNNFRIPAIIGTEKGTVLTLAEGREAGEIDPYENLLFQSFKPEALFR